MGGNSSSKKREIQRVGKNSGALLPVPTKGEDAKLADIRFSKKLGVGLISAEVKDGLLGFSKRQKTKKEKGRGRRRLGT